MGLQQKKPSKFLIAPSILSANFARLGDEITSLEKAGADWIHVDVMDGHFVPNLTIGAPVVKALRPVTKLPLDVHLMIEEPERYVADFAKAGADYLTIHVESTRDVAGVLKQIRDLGVKPGITLRPRTPVESLYPFLSLVDLILVMTVEPGFGGQSFMPEQVSKLGQLRQELNNIGHTALLEVDGGVNADTATQLLEADVLVAGNYVFSREHAVAIRTLKEIKCST